MTAESPFQTFNKNGIRWVDAEVDQAFKNALLAGAPTRDIHGKLKRAFDRPPHANARQYSQEYFGDEMPGIVERIGPLINMLADHLKYRLKLPGLWDWMDLTGYGNSHHFISALADWSDLKKEKPN